MRRSVWLTALMAIAAIGLVLPATATEAPGKAKAGSLTQVGHEPLMNRGMNAAMAIHGDYAYIGSRTDGGHEDMPHGGVMVVDISDPSDPTLLGPPFDAKPGESSRELRVWRSQDILIVLNTNCGVGDALHHCTPAVDQQLPLLRHLGSERDDSAAAQPVQREHPRVLPVGGPGEP